VLLFDTQQVSYDYEAQEPSKAEFGARATTAIANIAGTTAIVRN
jgi:hypothetical protein